MLKIKEYQQKRCTKIRRNIVICEYLACADTGRDSRRYRVSTINFLFWKCTGNSRVSGNRIHCCRPRKLFWFSRFCIGFMNIWWSVRTAKIDKYCLSCILFGNILQKPANLHSQWNNKILPDLRWFFEVFCIFQSSFWWSWNSCRVIFSIWFHHIFHLFGCLVLPLHDRSHPWHQLQWAFLHFIAFYFYKTVNVGIFNFT